MSEKIIYFISFLCVSITCNSQNILWIVCEDQTSDFFSQYGDSTSYTPNLNELAAHSVVYENCFSTSPVCAPSRSSIITGCYPTTIGTHNMRNFKKNQPNKINKHNELPYYSPIIQNGVKPFTELLRARNYYCTNNSKEDYNFACPELAWDESSNSAHWRNRAENQPFFAVFNFSETHESKIWKNSNLTNYITKPIHLPPFLENDSSVQKDFATNYNNIERLDKQIGKLINQLKEDNLYDETIIFFFSDHGGPFLRYKRTLYDTGIKVPLIIKWLSFQKNSRCDDLVSLIDLAPTILNIAQINKPDYMPGKPIQSADKNKFIFAATDRIDDSIDRVRAIRSKRFKLIKNFDLNQARKKNIKYRKSMSSVNTIDSLVLNGFANDYLMSWYNDKQEIEFYDLENDPFEMKNLYYDKKYASEVERFTKLLDDWIDNTNDKGVYDEKTLLKMMWSDINEPKLTEPIVFIDETNHLTMYSDDKFASLGWRYIGEKNWRIYSRKIKIKKSKDIQCLASRIGYESNIITIQRE